LSAAAISVSLRSQGCLRIDGRVLEGVSAKPISLTSKDWNCNESTTGKKQRIARRTKLSVRLANDSDVFVEMF